MSDAKPRNPGLFVVHRIFMIVYALVVALMLAMALMSIPDLGAVGGLMLLALTVGVFAVGHWYAMQGAKLGKSYGRTISRIFGCFWLLGFPLGTALGIYVLVKAGNSHWQPDSSPLPAA